jgi:hypothetical protein
MVACKHVQNSSKCNWGMHMLGTIMSCHVMTDDGMCRGTLIMQTVSHCMQMFLLENTYTLVVAVVLKNGTDNPILPWEHAILETLLPADPNWTNTITVTPL